MLIGACDALHCPKLGLQVFVIDYFNWAVMGNLTFNPANWPEPKAMVDTLKSYGTKIMVSTWPFSQVN